MTIKLTSLTNVQVVTIYSGRSCSVVHQNAQRATNKSLQLEILCDELKPNIFVVSEHGYSAGTIDYFNIPNYELAASFQRTNYLGGGVAIFTKLNVNYRLFDLERFCKELDFEIAGITVSTANMIDLSVIGLYRTPDGDLRIFFEQLEVLLQTLYSKRLKFVLTGDFNINVLDAARPETKQLKDVLASFGLVWSINSPTRVTATSKTAIDNVVTNCDGVTTTVVHTAISDHDAQVIHFENCGTSVNSPAVNLSRSFDPSSIHSLKRQLCSERWNTLYPLNNVDEQFNFFFGSFSFHLDVSCPLKTFKEDRRPKKNTWITRGILISRAKLKQHALVAKTSNDENFKVFFKTYKKTYRKIIKLAKSFDINKKLTGTNNFSKTAWSVINGFKGGQGKIKKPIVIRVDDEEISDPAMVANGLNEFFASVGEMNVMTDHHVSNVPTNGPIASMVLLPVTEDEVAKVLKQLPSKKSTDVNGVSVWLLRECWAHLVSPLTSLVNASFESGVFPSALKAAKVIPIFKKGDPLEPSNYRPISILPAFSKVYEKLFLDRLLGFLDRHRIFSLDQFGFRKGKSTVDAIESFVSRIVDSLERKNPTLSVFLDLSKAFDCVEHSSLLTTVEEYGIRGVPLSWVASYLNGRTQKVQVANHLSDSIPMGRGVPQGSILGPVLFLLYVNNLSSAVRSGQITQYADDTTLCCSAKSNSELETQTFVELNSVIQFFSELNLKTNETKSKYINFTRGTSRLEAPPTVMAGDSVLEEVDCTTFLGIIIDNDLTWSCHLEKTCNKVSSSIFALRTLSKYCPQTILRTAYFGLIYPHITYGIVLWGGCADIEFLRLFRLQKKSIRIIGKMQHRESCRNAFREMNLLTLASVYILETVLFCKFKCDLVQGSDVHEYNTRGRELYRTAQNRLQLADRLPSQVGVKLINGLPESIRNEPSPAVFKGRLKRFLTHHAFYTVGEFFDHSRPDGGCIFGCR